MHSSRDDEWKYIKNFSLLIILYVSYAKTQLDIYTWASSIKKSSQLKSRWLRQWQKGNEQIHMYELHS
jgi:hypothetical protein